MSEFSMLWETQTGVGDGELGYTQGQANMMYRPLLSQQPYLSGVVYGMDNGLIVTTVAGGVSVPSGHAVVHGFRYWNTSSLTLSITPPRYAPAAGAVLLRADWLANTVRAVVVMKNTGDTTPVVVDQIDGNRWEIELARFVVDTDGTIYTSADLVTAGVTDTRPIAASALAYMVPLREFVGDGSSPCVFDYIQQDFRNLRIIGVCGSNGVKLGMYITANSSIKPIYEELRITSFGNSSIVTAFANAEYNIEGPLTPDAGSTGKAPGIFDIVIGEYAREISKPVSLFGGGYDTGGNTNTLTVTFSNMEKSASAPITRLDIIPADGAWVTGTRITLYGMR